MSKITPAEAIEALSDSFKNDSSFAWTWHCNLAMSFYDAGGDHETANDGAARFMKLAFGVDTSDAEPKSERL